MKPQSHPFRPSLAALLLALILCACSAEPAGSVSWREVPITVGFDPEKPLNGMLTLPQNAAAPPVVLLIQGSGPNSMDSPIGVAGNRMFADLAHGLAERGVASVRYDKRSYAYPDDVTDIQTEYLYDVKAAVDFIQADPRVDKDRLYLLGHSQGGMLAPKLAAENPGLKGLISMGGTLRPMEDIILEQNKTLNQQDPAFTEEERAAADAQIAELVNKIKSLSGEADASPDILLYGYPETYWKSLNAIDSLSLAQDLADKAYPMLILQGKNDFQVLYETDYALWQEVTAHNPNADCIAYDGLSHVFMPGKREPMDPSVYDAPAHVDETVIQDIAEWIAGQAS